MVSPLPWEIGKIYVKYRVSPPRWEMHATKRSRMDETRIGAKRERDKAREREAPTKRTVAALGALLGRVRSISFIQFGR